MPKFNGEPDYTHGSEPCLGVLITNLGTPTAPTTKAVRKYLAEFLWDPRVVEIPRPLWWLILHGIILPTYSSKSAKAYAKVWTDEGSPLLVISKKQRSALQIALDGTLPGKVRVELAMRYGEPSIPTALNALRASHARRILVLPLYPQYSASTTASTFDAIAQEFKHLRWLPELRMVNQYAAQPEYIDTCVEQIQTHWQKKQRSQKLLFSFHGLPKRNLLLGDPYHCECQLSARLIAEKLALKETEWEIAFQSRFGKAEWLQPYTVQRLSTLPSEGIKSIDVFCPGFSADCLETLEEMDIQNHKIFLQNGGESFNYIPALNAEPSHIEALVKIILQHTQGWPESCFKYSEAVDKEAIRQRALRLGAKQ